MWDDPKRIEQQPYFGWLQTLVPTYGDTLSLKTLAHENEVGYIPTIKVTDEHQLRYDQENGITYQAALDKVQQILKEWHKKSVALIAALQLSMRAFCSIRVGTIRL